MASFITIEAAPRAAVEWIAELCIAQAWTADQGEARELAERWAPQVCTALRNQLDELHRLGRITSYTFNSSSEYMLQGAAFIEPRDSAAVQEAKRRLLDFDGYAEAMARVTPKDFEALCAAVLNALGVEDASTTSYSADEGIDFYGRMKLEPILTVAEGFPGVERQLAVHMIGQAKHYQAIPISTLSIRELVGSVELAKGRAVGSHASPYIDLPMRVCDPVFFMFLTTGRISSDGWRLIDTSGVIGMDGQMIAAFLAQRLSPLGPLETHESRLSEWIHPFRQR